MTILVDILTFFSKNYHGKEAAKKGRLPGAEGR
ncbi:hypothetical protein CLV42_11383 [Chitinophaga ginsengisoli]|uniref:Uncharacterized protein n=1 Tax=Chitinophaga ginsengisoli TaxID=363837 RepID=A0A2P8FUL6_9BACT|nr:hypothetical protein CLV42_11383 [Chitinophaga ginsengisoli]